jgi:hypothetical protein
MLGVDDSRVRQRLAERTLYGIKLRSGWRLPLFQFDDGQAVPGIDVVFPCLDPGLHPVAVYQWFTTPAPDLLLDDQPVSPRDWLRAGASTTEVAAFADAL